MNYLKEKERIEADLKARRIRLNLVKDQYNLLQHKAEELAVKNFKDEARIKELDDLIAIEKPTYANHIKLTRALGLMFFIIPSFLFAQDTIHVKKVRVCNTVRNKWGVQKKFFKNIKVKTGYIVSRGNGIYEINGKEMKGEFDSLIAKK